MGDSGLEEGQPYKIVLVCGSTDGGPAAAGAEREKQTQDDDRRRAASATSLTSR